jgi:hypothetical protein
MSLRRNRLRAIGLMAIAVMAFTAVAASSASAHVWTTGTKFTSGQKAAVTPFLKSKATLEGIVSGLNVKLSSEELVGSGTEIVQEGTGASGVAAATGKLIFKKLTLTEPAGCSPPTEVSTTALKGRIVTKPQPKEKGKQEEGTLLSGTGFTFTPASETVPTLFATVTLTGSCAIAGTPFKVTTTNSKETLGGVCGETLEPGVLKTEQPINFTGTINKHCGGTLFTGGNPATLTGEAFNKLTATPTVAWGALKE